MLNFEYSIYNKGEIFINKKGVDSGLEINREVISILKEKN